MSVLDKPPSPLTADVFYERPLRLITDIIIYEFVLNLSRSASSNIHPIGDVLLSLKLHLT